LRRFSRHAIAAALIVVGGYVAAHLMARWRTGPAGSSHGTLPRRDSAASEQDGVAGDGDELVREVLAALERWPNVSAKFRQTLRIGDDRLSGAGQYWQRGVGNQRRTRLEWKTAVAGETATFHQIFDKNGRLWTDFRLADARTVERIDMTRLRRELTVSTGQRESRAGENLTELELLARGGLSQLIAELHRCFTFGPPEAAAQQGRPLWRVMGTWRPTELAETWPSLNPDSDGNWPLHLPRYVALWVGRDDRFPYIIEYGWAGDRRFSNSAAANQTVADPIARYEFFDVTWNTSMPEWLFEFTPTDVDWRDATARVVERLRPVPRQAAVAAPRAGAWR
jgi:hypothetical protein